VLLDTRVWSKGLCGREIATMLRNQQSSRDHGQIKRQAPDALQRTRGLGVKPTAVSNRLPTSVGSFVFAICRVKLPSRAASPNNARYPMRIPQRSPRFCAVYRHYLTGKLMHAADYGYRAWPFGRRG